MMNYKILFFLIFCIFSCVPKNINTKQNNIIIPKNSFSNAGFALLYTTDLRKNKIINRKIEDRSLIIFQKNLKKNTNVKITNLLNNKTILAKVGTNAKYPNFYNSVLSKRIYEELELNDSEPYIEIIAISQNNTFIAKKTKMFDEEKEVADKAPVEGISISDLNPKKISIKKNKKKNDFSYVIKIADFYYKESAILLKKRILDELKVKNVKINKISSTNHRVFLGPFDNLKTLKKAFDDINPLNFENIEIIKL